ncbi:MAG: solute carrier family 23 protein [Desulfobacterales bacterium]|jgi:uracil permease
MPEQTSSPDYKLTLASSLFGAQILFVVFGGLVTLPVLTGLDPGVALLTAGAGTLIFQFITQRKVPVFLASSFAFLAPIMVAVKTWGIPATMGGLMVAALSYFILSGLIKWKGKDLLDLVFPPIVAGPIIIVIGLLLAPVAVSMALGKGNPANLIPQKSALIVALISLATAVIVSLFGKGKFRLVPILCGMLAGYLASIPFGIIDFSVVAQAPWIALPGFVLPQWSWKAVVFLLPAGIAPAIGHFGDILAIGAVTGKNYLKDPGVHRTLFGDGVSSLLAACMGGPPNSAYTEVTGTMAFTKLYNPAIMTWAAIFAIGLAFVGKLGAFIQTIPTPVTGGLLILLFGIIIVTGINSLVKVGQDLLQLRNLLIVTLMLVFGIGGIVFSAGAFTFEGVALATVLGIILNLVLPDKTVESN